MKKYTGYLIDLDGTIYQGTDRIEGAQAFIAKLNAQQINYLFLTNNSTKTPTMVAEFLTTVHGIQTSVEQIYTSAMATADYLVNNLSLDAGTRIFAIGEMGLKQALTDAGYILTDEQPDVVVIGMDTQVTYAKFEKAALAIRNGAIYVATNLDTNIPNERGLVPGAGSLNALITTATGIQPLAIGKPNAQIVNLALARMKIQSTEALLVGDNYFTDIMAGINAQVDTLMTYTGISTRAEVAEYAQAPTYEVENLNDWQV